MTISNTESAAMEHVIQVSLFTAFHSSPYNSENKKLCCIRFQIVAWFCSNAAAPD